MRKVSTLAVALIASLALASSAHAAGSYRYCGSFSDDRVYAGAVTTCSFARNVYREIPVGTYYTGDRLMIHAYSAAARREYRMHCVAKRGGYIRCRGGVHALVDIVL